MDRRQLHAGRRQVLEIYESWIRTNLISKNISIAVVGGGQDEVELEIFKELGFEHEVSFFGISDNDYYCDLNIKNQISTEMFGAFDLVICCQVLEHIWNIQLALENLASLVTVDGLIWINVPSSNLKHGSPEYFSAGYQPELLENLLSLYRFETLLAGDLGSKRLYFMTHKQQFWPTYLEHRFPLLRGIHDRVHLFPLKFLKHLMKNFQTIFWSPKFNQKTQFSTETYYLGKRLNGRA
jgi:SAM-dependent methyltransferase